MRGLRKSSIVAQEQKSKQVKVKAKPRQEKKKSAAASSTKSAKRQFRVEQSSTGLVIPTFYDDEPQAAAGDDELRVTEESVWSDDEAPTKRQRRTGLDDDDEIEFLATGDESDDDDDDDDDDDEDEEDEEKKPAGKARSGDAFFADLKALYGDYRKPDDDLSDDDGVQQPWNLTSALHATKNDEADTFQTSLSAKIRARLGDDADDDKAQIDDKADNDNDDDNDDDNEDDNDDDNEDDNDDDNEDDNEDGDDEEDSDDDNDDEAAKRLKRKKEQFKFAERPEDLASGKTFHELNLSRGLLKAVNRLGYTRPTPIQQEAIPVALLGRDLCASAVTGSGKTAAFMLPILERLQYRSRRMSVTRVIVLLPTRELAAQCHAMTLELAQYTDVTAALVVGGLSINKQAEELRRRPDIVVATPGRLIDHVLNSRALVLDDVEILVLDEADRLLDMGFEDELKQLISECPRKRQTMLFSATMTEAVDRLIKLSLDHPVRVAVDTKYNVAGQLTQEFIRVREHHEAEREAMLFALLEELPAQLRIIVFVRSKLLAHRLSILCGLFKLPATELHGNLTQAQRLEALDLFQKQQVRILVATDLASRGLDIPGVDVVVNLHLPLKLKAYVHRVGRTARAGNAGVACSFVGETDRRIFKAVLKSTRRKQRDGDDQKIINQSRTLVGDAVIKWSRRIEEVETLVADIVAEERAERQLRLAEQERRRIENIVVHHDEIYSRPAKQWFQSKQERQLAQEKSKATVTGSTNMPLTEKMQRKQERREQAKKQQKEAEAKKLAKLRRGLPGSISEDEVHRMRVEKSKAMSLKRKLRREAQLRGVTPMRAAQILDQQRAAKDGSLEAKAKRNKERRLAESLREVKNADKAAKRKRVKPLSAKKTHKFHSKMRFKRK